MATTASAHQILDDEALAEEKLLEELENEEIPAHIREARLDSLKKQAGQFRVMQQKGYGIYNELDDEKEVLDLTTSEDKCVVHFFHEDFRRCAILDNHLKILTDKYFETRFAKINVEKAKFLVKKLKIQMLPAVLCFINGIVSDRVVGFEELGGSDGFQTIVLERRLAKSGVIEMAEEQMVKKTIFGYADTRQNNEDSDSDGY